MMQKNTAKEKCKNDNIFTMLHSISVIEFVVCYYCLLLLLKIQEQTADTNRTIP